MQYFFVFLLILGAPLPAMAGQEPSAQSEFLWALLMLAGMLIGFYLMRRWMAKSKLARLNRSFLQNQRIHERENEFFFLMSQMAGKPAKFSGLRRQIEQWERFRQNNPDNKYGLFAGSLLKATLISNGAGMLAGDEAMEIMRQSQQEADKALAGLGVEQRSLLNLALAMAYMRLAAGSQQQSQDKYFARAVSSMLNALSGELKIYQMVNILVNLGQAYHNMAKRQENETHYLQQGFDYLSMAIALSPHNRTSLAAMNQLCAYWASQEGETNAREKLQSISRECRFGRYQQLGFDKDLWLLRLAAVMGREKTCRGKLEEMLAAQEELLFAAMRNDHYLDEYRRHSWFQQIMEQAKRFER